MIIATITRYGYGGVAQTTDYAATSRKHHQKGKVCQYVDAGIEIFGTGKSGNPTVGGHFFKDYLLLYP